MIRPLCLSVLVLLASCTGKAPSKEADKPDEGQAAEKMADTVKAEKKSLDEAADAAAKLVEEESRQEIEAIEETEAE